MGIKFIKGTDKEQLFSAGADELLTILKSQIALSDSQVVLGLCGGRSIVGLLKALVATPNSDQVLSKIKFFMVDERLVPLDHEDSNFKLLNELMFLPQIVSGAITQDQVHPFIAQSSKTDWGVGSYLTELSEFGGKFSTIVLSMGEDGHVAGLFPEHPMLAVSDKVFLAYEGSPKPPQQRMTASIPLLQTADSAILLALGEPRKDAFKRFMDPGVSVEKCPSKLVEGISNVCVVTDLG